MKMHRIALFSVILLSCLFSTSAWTKGGEIKFGSNIVSVSQSDTSTGSIEVTIHDVVVPVMINGDTELFESGEEISLIDLAAGSFARIDAFFSDEGLVADEVEIVDHRDEQFRLRGSISAVDTVAENTVVTLLGIDVTITADTDITRRGDGSGNDVLASELQVNDSINVSGGVDNGLLVANRIHVGTREQGNIELEGEITALSDTEITIAIDGGTSVVLVIDENTSIVGELAAGVFIEAEGQLLQDISLLAFEIVADADGDGDADDDNRRGKRGDENSNRGRGNGNGNGNGNNDDDSDDDDDDSDASAIVVSAETVLEADGVQANGSAEFAYESEDDEVEQEVEIELEDADADSTYGIVVYFGDTAVEFGDFTTNSFGELEVKFRSDPDDDDESLEGLLPEGQDVRDISVVQILLDGDVILEGDF